MKKTAILLSLIISVNAQDITAPTVSTYSPADGATGVSLTANLVLTFSENVSVGSGNITIKKSSNNSTVETINVVSDTGNVSISGST
ncbi:MAG: Ig-like domain-containing protein, partial [Candidatus Marinimicrobia bacterium]|nr:Ig-like domain-containing protein [Candidatus Neomarinimicrobiota bacterium]